MVLAGLAVVAVIVVAVKLGMSRRSATTEFDFEDNFEDDFDLGDEEFDDFGLDDL
jgi:hypothetical protein